MKVLNKNDHKVKDGLLFSIQLCPLNTLILDLSTFIYPDF